MTPFLIDETKAFFKAIFPNRRTYGTLSIGALPSKEEAKKAEEFEKMGSNAPKSLRPHWNFFGSDKEGYESAINFLTTVGAKRGMHMRQGRFRGDAASAKRVNVIENTHCWIDIDVKHHLELYRNHTNRPDLTVDDLIDECLNVLVTESAPLPTVLVKSGGGVHAYWTLKESAITEEHIWRVEECNQYLAQVFGADRNPCRANASLRIPGSSNTNYDPPRPCSLFEVTDAQHDLTDLLSWAQNTPPMWGPDVFTSPEANLFTGVGQLVSGGLGKGPNTPEEWAQLVKGLGVGGEMTHSVTRISGKLSRMGVGFDDQVQIMRQNGCDLIDSRLHSIINYCLGNHNHA